MGSYENFLTLFWIRKIKKLLKTKKRPCFLKNMAVFMMPVNIYDLKNFIYVLKYLHN